MTRAQRLLSIGTINVAWKAKLTSLKSGGSALAVGLLLSSLGLVTTARADLFDGSTAGAFSNGSTNLGTSIGPELSFLGTSFDAISPGADFALGSFTLHNGNDTDFSLYTFALTVTFTAPPDAFGDPVIGTVTGLMHGNDGSVDFTFLPIAPFSYNSGGSSFNLLVNDFSLEKTARQNPSVSGFLTGRITPVTFGDVTSSVPEPRPYDFLITAIGGVVFLLYRHRYGRC